MSTQGNNVEHKIVYNIIPTTRKWGIISAVIAGIGLLVSGQIILAVLVPILYYSSVMAFLVLLEGYAEIIALLRKITINTNTLVVMPQEISHGYSSKPGIQAKPSNAASRPDPSRPKLSIPNSVITGADLSTADKCIEFLRFYDFQVNESAPGQWSIASPNNSTISHAYSLVELRRHITSLGAS